MRRGAVCSLPRRLFGSSTTYSYLALMTLAVDGYLTFKGPFPRPVYGPVGANTSRLEERGHRHHCHDEEEEQEEKGGEEGNEFVGR